MMKGPRLLPKRYSGVTMIELMVTIAVLAILLTIAVPSASELIKNSRVASQNNELVSLAAFARSEAIRRSATVPLIITATTNGWNAVVKDPAEEADVVGCVAGQLRCASNSQVTLTSGSVTLNFNSRGYIRASADPFERETIYLEHEDCSGDRQRRRIDILPTGQITSCSLKCGDGDTAC